MLRLLRSPKGWCSALQVRHDVALSHVIDERLLNKQPLTFAWLDLQLLQITRSQVRRPKGRYTPFIYIYTKLQLRLHNLETSDIFLNFN